MIFPLAINAVWADDEEEDEPVEEIVVTAPRVSTGTINLRLGFYVPYPSGGGGGNSSTQERERAPPISNTEKMAACGLTVGATVGVTNQWVDDLVGVGKQFKYTARVLSITPQGRMVKIIRSGNIVGGAVTAYHLCVI